MSGSFFKGEYDYTNLTRSIDNMLEQFHHDRQQVISLLKRDPQKLKDILWSDLSPICKDDDCLFMMGKSLNLSIEDILEKKKDVCDSMVNFYICPQCKNMRRIVDFAKTSSDEPFVLECGDKAGSSLVYDQVDISNLYMIFEKEPASVKKAYMHPSIIDLALCSSGSCQKSDGLELLKKYADLHYLGSDPFTNNLLINYYLGNDLLYHDVPNIFAIYISWVCSEYGYNLYDYCDIKSLASFQNHSELLTNSGKLSPTAKADDKTPISFDVVSGLIMQLFATLHHLRKFDFSHGSPKTSSIKFKSDSVSYIIDGVHVTCPVTLKLTDFSSSGCTVLESKTRLYSKSVVADEVLKKKIYEPIIETSNDSNVTIYKLKDPKKYYKSSILFMYMKHLGLPLYSASFDAYAFMVVFMCERAFYSTVLDTPKLNSFWREMWDKNDFPIITNRIIDYHEKSKNIETMDILSILSGLSLRCDMIDFGWNMLKTF